MKSFREIWPGNPHDFVCLCFGLGSALGIFSKLLKIPIALLLVIYLDDILLIGITEEILINTKTLIFLPQLLVFVINLKKSTLKPSQQIEFLCLNINTHTITLALTEEKMNKVVLKCQNLLSRPQTTVLQLKKDLMSSTV